MVTYLYPANIFISVLFPAPEGPIIAVSSPDLNVPFIHLSKALYPRFLPSLTEYERSENSMSTGGRLGKCVSVAIGFFWSPYPLGIFGRPVIAVVPAPPLQRLIWEPLKQIT